MGLMQRRKGRRFEQDVATAFRQRWPHLTVRRAQQSGGAFEPDVVVEGVPLWTECCVGAKPNPLVKLAQAERDVERFTEMMLPVVVWRKSGEWTMRATMRLGVLLETTRANFSLSYQSSDLVITVDFDEWLACVDLAEARQKEAA